MACDWRKLWIRPAAELEGLPLMAQAIDALARRHADDAGLLATLPSTAPASLDAAAEEVAFQLRARPSEAAIVVNAARLLLDAGALVLDGRAVLIAAFVEEQKRVEPSALRKRAQRERERTAKGLPPRDSHGAPRDGHAKPRDNVTDKTRPDQTRREETRQDLAPVADAPAATALQAPLSLGVVAPATKSITRDAAEKRIADRSGGNYIAGGRQKGGTFKLDAARKAHPDGAIFSVVGDWLKAGGDWRTAKGQKLDGRNLGDLEGWIAQAAAWDTAGRPDLATTRAGAGSTTRPRDPRRGAGALSAAEDF